MEGSLFFITLADNLDYLDEKFTIFGQVAEGLDVLSKMNECLVDDQNLPYIDIRIKETFILDDPYEDPPGMIVPKESPRPSAKILAKARISTSQEESVIAEFRNQQAKEQLLVASTNPKSLFVCKLNPRTTVKDLVDAFSQYGNVVRCDLARDKITGHSLKYAFIEYATEGECERAFYQMNNSVINDYRIAVDFAQPNIKRK